MKNAKIDSRFMPSSCQMMFKTPHAASILRWQKRPNLRILRSTKQEVHNFDVLRILMRLSTFSTANKPGFEIIYQGSRERTQLFPSKHRRQFKRMISKRQLKNQIMRTLCGRRDENPWLLINTSGDYPAIQGSLYNVLHVGVRVGAGEIVAKTLLLTSDIKFLVRLYGTNDADVLIRRENIMTEFLCTLDKGNIGTPLVIALKFGHTSVVKAITAFATLPLCDAIHPRLNLNIPCYWMTQSCALGLLEKKSKKEIKSPYVPLYRAHEGTYPASSPSNRISWARAWVWRLSTWSLRDTPTTGEESAQKFYREWDQSVKIIKRRDMDEVGPHQRRDDPSPNPGTCIELP
ncbi:unnamed protein product, partial [Mesorhabditis belari]|uniref:Uncharacterized protein n=1 Tax=Mesorhabditis belari TaxID=2138241 RepID=A0AAF3ERW6_9BILA